MRRLLQLVSFLALAGIVGSYIYRQRALGAEGIEARLRAATPLPLPGSEDLEPTERACSRLVAHYQTTTIIVLALRAIINRREG